MANLRQLHSSWTLSSFAMILAVTLVALPTAHAQTYSVIHTFTGPNGGAFPVAGVTLRGGNLYGTTTEGGQPYAYGNVYELMRVGDNWLPTQLYIFTKGSDGYGAQARPVFGPDGHLYGAVTDFPSEVFKLTPPLSICRTVNCFWRLDVVHLFELQNDVSGMGYGDLVWDQQGNLYGTGDSALRPYTGGVYELSPSGNGWVETILYKFQGSGDAASPDSGVIWDKNGNLFGAAAGGAHGYGAIYELIYTVGLGWTEKVIYSFTNLADGPPTGITFDQNGNLFGATRGNYGGDGGTIFELSPSGDTWTYKLLYTFPAFSAACAAGTERPLTIDAAGNLYGTTACGGAYQQGAVFKMNNTGNGWLYSSLYDFTGGADGAIPLSTVTIDTDGTLYGTTSGGGSNVCGGGCGVVWKIQP
jgi:uncharacterized repeat protein (TIGR03803 family)